jgi:hypothetical protein
LSLGPEYPLAQQANANFSLAYTPDYEKVKWGVTKFWRVVSEGEWFSIKISARERYKKGGGTSPLRPHP